MRILKLTPRIEKCLLARRARQDAKAQSIAAGIVADVRKRAAAQAQRIRGTAAAVAELDVTASLAQVAAENRYQRPSRTWPRGGLV